MVGRVETYTHSDLTTENKGSAIAVVSCETDFAARTKEFKDFCKKIAMYTYAVTQENEFTPAVDSFDSDIFHVSYESLVSIVPEIEEQRKQLEETLKEKITILTGVKVTL